jgi:hypothetical protein
MEEVKAIVICADTILVSSLSITCWTSKLLLTFWLFSLLYIKQWLIILSFFELVMIGIGVSNLAFASFVISPTIHSCTCRSTRSNMDLLSPY